MLGAQVWPGPPDKKQLGFDFIPVAVGGLWGRGRRLSRAVTAPSFEMHLLLGLCFFECSSDILRIQGLEGRREFQARAFAQASRELPGFRKAELWG